ncbi:hypothetical protein BJ878DRAFT_535234 [Calycina marina]|uniref:C2H2-type domain-containing protein n=1 Tax=Calycina marina TaxID=1763456 RepID=A0A9P7Z1L7_9HELO|nr:hypothetical protein BJ878DRAFT_535234 [Calycina marina]
MPPRGFTNPAPKTDSAREAVKSFYCELCAKGYSRMNEYEAHLSSYDHSHKQRLKDMKQLTRDPLASSKARKAEAKANAGSGLISIKIRESGGTSAAKKGGFKKVGFKSAFKTVDGEGGQEEEIVKVRGDDQVLKRTEKVLMLEEQDVESDTDVEYEMYDPRFPTD